MAEAELHVLRARLEGGIKNKASRGELRRGLPVGLVWGEAGGQIGFHPDVAVTRVITATFEQFAGRGSVRAPWLWVRGQGPPWALPRGALSGEGGVLPGVPRDGPAPRRGRPPAGKGGPNPAAFSRGPAKVTPNYYCQAPAELVDGRGARHMNVGGQVIDAAVAGAFLPALAPAALDACLAAAQ